MIAHDQITYKGKLLFSLTIVESIRSMAQVEELPY